MAWLCAQTYKQAGRNTIHKQELADMKTVTCPSSEQPVLLYTIKFLLIDQYTYLGVSELYISLCIYIARLFLRTRATIVVVWLCAQTGRQAGIQ